MAVGVADKLEAQGISVTAVDPRWVLPVADDLVDLARRAGAVAVIEDNLVTSGSRGRGDPGPARGRIEVPVHVFGIPKQFLDHASRAQVLEEVGLTADAVATSLATRLR